MNQTTKNWALLATLALATALLSACSTTRYADATKAYSRGEFATAYQEYLALAKAGDVRAQGTVACMIQAGEGVGSDPAQALPWYTKAAEKGLKPAQYSLGLAYEKGLGTRQDLAQALVWYGKAAEHGDARAAADYRRLQAPGAGPAAAPALASTALKDPVQPMPKVLFENWKLAEIRGAAESGDADAQIYLGWRYSSGKGAAQDKSEAAVWYLKAAQSGRLDALTALGWLYFSDATGKRDLNEAAKWYVRAAAQGDATARVMLQRISQLEAGD
jgi:uncharacterized protein